MGENSITKFESEILLAINTLNSTVAGLAKEVQALKSAPVECGRLSFRTRDVVAIISILGVLNLGSGTAMYFGLSNIVSTPQIERPSR
jgi:hypothetical protein